MKPAPAASQVQILRSSVLMGGTSLATLAVGLARTKLLALLLGPAGVGLLATYLAIVDMARGLAALGLPQSGVRQVAEAAACGDDARIARTARLLRRLGLGVALVGGAGLALGAAPVAWLSFGSEARAGAVALLGLAVAFGIAADLDLAVLQGLRRLRALSQVTVVAAALGAAATVTAIAGFGEAALAPAVALAAALAALLARRAARRAVGEAQPRPALAAQREEALALLRLGLAFMASALLVMGSAWLVRVLVLRQAGLEAAGLYQAGWSLGSLYAGFVLAAMGTDFYPRLVAHVDDPASANRLVNEQTQVGMLLAGPGIVATLALAGPLLHLLYSRPFEAAADVLAWTCAACALRVVSYPLGYVIVAGGRRSVFVAVEAIWTAAHLGLAAWLVPRHGASGAGLAYCGAYLLHALVLYPLVRRRTGFAWSSQNRRGLVVFLGLAGSVLAAHFLLPPAPAFVVGAFALAASLAHALRELLALLHDGALPPALAQRLARLRPAARRALASARGLR